MALKPISQFRRRSATSGGLYCCAAWILLAMFMVAIVGVPMPVKVEQTIGGAYPCQHGTCGCASAAQCWDKCCCHNDLEKLAWANEHHVNPPAFLVERVAKQQALSLASAPVTKSCCSTRKASSHSGSSDSVLIQKTALIHKTCCSSKPAQVEASASDDTRVTSKLTVVRLEDAAQCRGMQHVWTLLSSMVMGPAQPKSMRPEPPLIGWLRVKDERASSYVSAIDPPVPWVLLSL